MENLTLSSLLENFREKFEQRPIRDRVLIALAVALGIYAVLYYFIIAPMSAEIGAIQKKTDEANLAKKVFDAKLIKLVEQPLTEEEMKKKEKYEQLQSDLTLLEEELSLFSKQLISPEEMRELVRRVVKADRKLVLKQIENYDPETVDAAVPNVPAGKKLKKDTAAKQKSTAGPLPTAKLYKHATRVTVEGEFSDIVAYLARLEKLPWRVFWGEVELVSQEHPYSQLSIELYTLSDNQFWLKL